MVTGLYLQLMQIDIACLLYHILVPAAIIVFEYYHLYDTNDTFLESNEVDSMQESPCKADRCLLQ